MAIDGRLQTRSYEDKDGNKRKAFDVVADEMQMLSGKGEGGGGDRSRSAPAPAATAQQRSAPAPGPSGDGYPPGYGEGDLGIDDIPF